MCQLKTGSVASTHGLFLLLSALASRMPLTALPLHTLGLTLLGLWSQGPAGQVAEGLLCRAPREWLGSVPSFFLGQSPYGLWETSPWCIVCPTPAMAPIFPGTHMDSATALLFELFPRSLAS